MRMGGDCMTRHAALEVRAWGVRIAVRMDVRIAGTDDTIARRPAVNMVVRARE